jgi:FkbM family methyltransferase
MSEYQEIFINQIYDFDYTGDTPTIIDGGGHIGISALYFLKRYPLARLTVFEPSEEMLHFLRKNLTANGFTNVQIIPAALGKTEGEMSFTSGDDDGKIDVKGNITVAVKQLSKHLPPHVNFIKLNIEGAEIDVVSELESAGVLPRIDRFCIEWHSFANQEQNLSALLSIFERNGYRYYINDFNSRINPVLQTPFRPRRNNRYFLLIYAQKNHLLA